MMRIRDAMGMKSAWVRRLRYEITVEFTLK